MTENMVKHRLIPALAAALVLTLTAPAWAGSFLSVMEDLPLAPGLEEQAGALQFDSPTGQIVEATASGNIKADAVLNFYAETLPQLGWEKIGEGAYRRDKEVLRIETSGHKMPVQVRFRLVPQ